jgi:hypothetical protein
MPLKIPNRYKIKTKNTYMKNLMIAGILAVAFTACDSKSNDVEAAKQAAIDSMNNVAALEAKQRTIDSMNAAQSHHHASASSNNNNTGGGNQTATTETEKKKMSNKTKGALIGTGAGIITGAAAGALLNKEDPAKGAVIGGAVGGAVGSGVGYGAGNTIDNKKKKTTTTTTTNP